MKPPSRINVRSCAICGLDHDGLKLAERPDAPSFDGYDYFAICPTTQRRIYVSVVEASK